MMMMMMRCLRGSDVNVSSPIYEMPINQHTIACAGLQIIRDWDRVCVITIRTMRVDFAHDVQSTVEGCGERNSLCQRLHYIYIYVVHTNNEVKWAVGVDMVCVMSSHVCAV